MSVPSSCWLFAYLSQSALPVDSLQVLPVSQFPVIQANQSRLPVWYYSNYLICARGVESENSIVRSPENEIVAFFSEYEIMNEKANTAW